MRGPVRAAILLALLATGGCEAFRASAGPCIGLGGSVHVGPADAGFGGGVSYEVGNAYGAIGSQITVDVSLGVARLEVLADGSTRRHPGDKAPVRARGEGLVIDALYPFVRSRHDVRAYLVDRPTEVSVSCYALFLAVHLGFDPLALGRELWGFVREAAGADMPEPPDGSFRDPPPPEDGRVEPPYTVVASEDLAALESGTKVERAAARKRVSDLLRDPLALFSDTAAEVVELDVPVSDGLPRLGLDGATYDELARPDETSAHDAFERAIEAGDPDALEEALHRYPFADGVTRAARVRAELLVERGELDEALASLERLTERDAASDDDDVKRARAILPAVRELRDRAPTEPAGEAWSGSADMGGFFLGCSGRAVWAVTAGGDVAWERSDALAADFYARKVVGKAGDLAIVEAISHARPWVLALDEEGQLRWSVPLPAPAPGCGPMDQVYALSAGRVFVGRTDRAIAIEARSGRLLWMHVRHDPDPPAKKLWKEAVPMDWRPPEGPERRRPDGPHGFRIRVTPGVLELTSGADRRVERLDARTGELLGEE